VYAAILTYRPGNGKSAEEIVRSLEAAVPGFSGLRGLRHKFMAFDDDTMTGTSIYIWDSLEAARACFDDPAFQARFRKTFGTEPEIRYSAIRAVVDNREA
jgi:heme-degrading monooxygenase HmoA